MKPKAIIGLVVTATVKGKNKKKKLKAKVDTGADKSSIDTTLASQLGLGPVIKTKKIWSAVGGMVRPVIKADIKINGKELNSDFTIADLSLIHI